MVYVFSLTAHQRRSTKVALDLDQVLTANVPDPPPSGPHGGQVALVFVRGEDQGQAEHVLTHMGIVQRPSGTKVASVGRRVKVEYLRGTGALGATAEGLALGYAAREDLRSALRYPAHPLQEDSGGAVLGALRQQHPYFARLIEWLSGILNSARLDNARPADRLWRQERDALHVALRISGFPAEAVDAWQRPAEGEPYLAGLIPDPTEQSLIEHDVRASVPDGWARDSANRTDITVATDGQRRLEVTNINATPVEARLGADLLYYHENTRSFTLVQYKKLNRDKFVRVDDRLLSQVDRLADVAGRSRQAATPEEWRLGTDSCFVKLAHWPDGGAAEQRLAPGMYLPVSYLPLLLEDPRLLGEGGGRRLGYDTVPRYLTNSQFIDLVKDGLVGTVGTTAENLRDLVQRRAQQGFGVVVAAERGVETAEQRQERNRVRSQRRRSSAADPVRGQERLL
ncbi:hypothetical protein FZ103_07055 [Streptomonospora sp. PA3]|uniref:hypothetical protein n=1 Tax=Streptomonospora sp. PA3 TaxID=2607326 RepID=UPI0012DFBA4A|nr:hypothetical protein [Streptomonospora sp. PA3]MUL40946.1 hypothetical protein [Streptomonospora sp. PA3]